MDLDSVMKNETIDRENAMRAIKTAAGVTVGAAGGSLLVGGAIGLGNAMRKNPEVNQAVKAFDYHEPIDSAIKIVNSTDIGKKGYDAVDTALRTYFDARAYVIATGLNQANTRLSKAGVYSNFATSIGEAGKLAGETSGYTPEVVQNVTSNLAKIANSSSANRFIDAGQETVSESLANPQVANTLTNLNNVNSSDISSAVEKRYRSMNPRQ